MSSPEIQALPSFGPAAELLPGASRRAQPLLWGKSSQNQ